MSKYSLIYCIVILTFSLHGCKKKEGNHGLIVSASELAMNTPEIGARFISAQAVARNMRDSLLFNSTNFTIIRFYGESHSIVLLERLFLQNQSYVSDKGELTEIRFSDYKIGDHQDNTYSLKISNGKYTFIDESKSDVLSKTSVGTQITYSDLILAKNKWMPGDTVIGFFSLNLEAIGDNKNKSMLIGEIRSIAELKN